ncbi:MAG: hypothetical protein B6226_04755 [Candidatus Cloacimonetes bacterium 4572_65]|nr:MAG: hypothetical protein B6226_04755 [Candidatus Cloacimonetes bacterium 4572_65]
MLQSIKLLLVFVAGITIAWLNIIPFSFNPDLISEYLLYILVFGVGVVLAKSEGIFTILKRYHIKLFLIPLMVIVGSLGSSALLALVIKDVSFKHGLGLGAGLGYYSLSSLMISKYGFKEIGAMALLINMIREIITLLFAPLLVRFFGRFAPIASGGATSMDTTLPVILKYTDEDNAIISMFNGVVLSMMVPLLITIIYELF